MVGYALPLRRKLDDGSDGYRWISGPWFLRREHMFLIPGDSPMGFRLPLESLPVGDPRRTSSPFYERDPFAPREPLPPRHVLRASSGRGRPSAGERRGGSGYDPAYEQPPVSLASRFPS